MVAIAESFAGQGAKQEDPAHGTGIPMNNRWWDLTWPNQIVLLSNGDAKMMVVMIRTLVMPLAYP